MIKPQKKPSNKKITSLFFPYLNKIKHIFKHYLSQSSTSSSISAKTERNIYIILLTPKNMAEITISIPEEIESDLKKLSRIKLSLAIARIIKPELERLARLKSIISHSKLTEKDVKELSEKTDEALSKRFIESLR